MNRKATADLMALEELTALDDAAIYNEGETGYLSLESCSQLTHDQLTQPISLKP
jgi:hypothetical protein